MASFNFINSIIGSGIIGEYDAMTSACRQSVVTQDYNLDTILLQLRYHHQH